MHRTNGVREDCQPLADLAERVVGLVQDVEPDELARVVFGTIREGRARNIGANRLHHHFESVLMVKVGQLEGRGLVGGVWVPLLAARGVALHERNDARPRLGLALRVGVARDEGVDDVVQTTEGAVDTQGLNQRGGLGITNVLPHIGVDAKDVIGGFVGGNPAEHRSTVFHAESATTGTVTNLQTTELVEHLLCHWARRGRQAAVDADLRREVLANRNGLGDSDVGCAEAIVQDVLLKLGEGLDGLADLFLNLEVLFEVVQADTGSPVALGFERPSADGVTEEKVRGIRDTTQIGDARAVVQAHGRPVGFHRVGQDAFNGKVGDGGTHPEREFADFCKTLPGRYLYDPISDIYRESTGFGLEQRVQAGTIKGHKVIGIWK